MQDFLIALSGSVILILLLRKLAHQHGLVDHPGGRKLHEQSTPTIGGVAMFIAVSVALWLGGGFTDEVSLLMGCAAILVLLGVLDDKHGLSVSLRMMLQVFLALMVIVGAGGMITHLGSLFGAGDIHLGLFAIPLSVVAFVGGINAMNMIDGADGVAGKMALVTTLGVGFIFYSAGVTVALPLVWAMLGALLGFLLFNTRLVVKRAWVFMGDAGSMWVGLVLGWFMAQVTGTRVDAEPALVLWLFGIPLIDTLTVMMRRMSWKRSPFAADRTHIHHVLEHAGLSIRQTVHILTLVQLLLVGMGVGFYLIGAPGWLVFWSFALLMGAYYYRLRNC